MMPLSAKSLLTSPILRMFSSRSVEVKPRLELRPWRMLSPSRQTVTLPRSARACSKVQATVDLPEPERPVNQRTQPFWSMIFSLVSLLGFNLI